jgi:hypothetical protein
LLTSRLLVERIPRGVKSREQLQRYLLIDTGLLKSVTACDDHTTDGT